MQQIRIGDITIASIIERDGPWRAPEAMFPAYDPAVGRRLLAQMDPVVYDPASNRMVITYQTFVVRTPKHTILVDTCTGDDKGYEAPMDFPKQPWLDGFAALGLRFEDIDYVFCTHLHIDHCGWNTRLVNGRWVPTFPKAKYVFHKREYDAWAGVSERQEPKGEVWRMNCLPVVEAGQGLLVDDDYSLDDTVWLTPTPGHSPCHCCVNIKSGGQRAVVTGDLMHHALQINNPDLSTVFDWDAAEGIRSRWKFFGEVAGTGALVLPVHFPAPTAGLIEPEGKSFRWDFRRG